MYGKTSKMHMPMFEETSSSSNEATIKSALWIALASSLITFAYVNYQMMTPAYLYWASAAVAALAGGLLHQLAQRQPDAGPGTPDAPSKRPSVSGAKQSLASAALHNSWALDNLLEASMSTVSASSRDSLDSGRASLESSPGSTWFAIRAHWGSISDNGSTQSEACSSNGAAPPIVETPPPSNPPFQAMMTWCTVAMEKLLRQVVVQMILSSLVMLAGLPLLASVSPWLCLALPVVGVVPFAMHAGLHAIADGFIVEESERRRKNSKFTHNVELLSYFNIWLTAEQGMLFILFAIWIGRVSLDILPADLTTLAGVFRVTWQAIFYLGAADVANYFFHRAAHENRWLYKHLHYLHHEHNQVEHALFSLFYVHPVEMFISNVCFFNGIFFLKSDLFTMMLYGTVSSVIVCAGHSGLRLPAWADAALDPSFHHLHHSRFKCNYSEHFTIMDRIFGTFVSNATVAKKEVELKLE